MMDEIWSKNSISMQYLFYPIRPMALNGNILNSRQWVGLSVTFQEIYVKVFLVNRLVSSLSTCVYCMITERKVGGIGFKAIITSFFLPKICLKLTKFSKKWGCQFQDPIFSPLLDIPLNGVILNVVMVSIDCIWIIGIRLIGN